MQTNDMSEWFGGTDADKLPNSNNFGNERCNDILMLCAVLWEAAGF